MSSTLNKVGIIVFSKNDGKTVIQTLSELLELKETYNIDIVYIDDFSSLEDFKLIEKYFKIKKNSEIRIVAKNKIEKPGITSSIIKGMDFTEARKIIPLPGHHMFSKKEISKLINESDKYDLVIGHRSNLFKARPIGKYLASKVLYLVSQIIPEYRGLKDLHGLNLYPKDLLIETLPLCRPHENHLIPLKIGIRKKLKIKIIKIEIRIKHKSESKKIGRRQWPKLSDIKDSVNDLINL